MDLDVPNFANHRTYCFVDSKKREYHVCGTEKLQVPEPLDKLWGWEFAGNQFLTTITLPSTLEHIANSTFKGLVSLESIVIPEKIISIPDHAFSGCVNLASVVLPTKLEDIGVRAFYGCERLVTIRLPSTLTHIGHEAFALCYNLKFVYSSPILEHIGMGAFYNCRSLKSIYLPDSIKCILRDAFKRCNSLTVYFSNTDYDEVESFDNAKAYVFPSTSNVICGGIQARVSWEDIINGTVKLPCLVNIFLVLLEKVPSELVEILLKFYLNRAYNIIISR